MGQAVSRCDDLTPVQGLLAQGKAIRPAPHSAPHQRSQSVARLLSATCRALGNPKMSARRQMRLRLRMLTMASGRRSVAVRPHKLSSTFVDGSAPKWVLRRVMASMQVNLPRQERLQYLFELEESTRRIWYSGHEPQTSARSRSRSIRDRTRVRWRSRKVPVAQRQNFSTALQFGAIGQWISAFIWGLSRDGGEIASPSVGFRAVSPPAIGTGVSVTDHGIKRVAIVGAGRWARRSAP